MKDIHGPDGSDKVSSHPVFGPPNHHSPDFNFQAELKHLPFPLNVGETPLDKEQQSRFLDITYDNQKVFFGMTRTLGTLTISLTQSQQPWISLYISLTDQNQDSYKLKYMNALTTGFCKE